MRSQPDRLRIFVLPALPALLRGICILQMRHSGPAQRAVPRLFAHRRLLRLVQSCRVARTCFHFPLTSISLLVETLYLPNDEALHELYNVRSPRRKLNWKDPALSAKSALRFVRTRDPGRKGILNGLRRVFIFTHDDAPFVLMSRKRQPV